jgi:lipopolysaccharide transport system ATP-binding protein
LGDYPAQAGEQNDAKRPMNDVVIRAEGLGKRYLIGHQAERYTALRDAIARAARGLARSAADVLRGRPLVGGDAVEEFWALKDVSFEVKRGEVMGIIGRNGAGKSTLLKILSRITEPSAGRVTIKGRVASLLEVGTGFHPELTGRENIYLNGAILGMTRAEIRKKFDEIVAFAEVERFLDTPVKRYSSGMYVRLAFAVAAHLEPEILVIDEVLAVGDAEFQKRCLGKMGEVASGGRTVLFVSHNTGAVADLCKRAVVMHEGRIVFSSSASRAIEHYLRAETAMEWVRKSAVDAGTSIQRVAIRKIPRPGRPAALQCEIEISSAESLGVSLDIVIKDGLLRPLAFATTGTHHVDTPTPIQAGMNRLRTIVDLPKLAVGRYSVSIFITRPFVAFHDRLDDILSFEIDPTDIESAQQPLNQAWGLGSVSLPLVADRA